MSFKNLRSYPGKVPADQHVEAEDVPPSSKAPPMSPETMRDKAPDREVGKGKPDEAGVYPMPQEWPAVEPRKPMRLKKG